MNVSFNTGQTANFRPVQKNGQSFKAIRIGAVKGTYAPSDGMTTFLSLKPVRDGLKELAQYSEKEKVDVEMLIHQNNFNNTGATNDTLFNGDYSGFKLLFRRKSETMPYGINKAKKVPSEKTGIEKGLSRSIQSSVNKVLTAIRDGIDKTYKTGEPGLLVWSDDFVTIGDKKTGDTYDSLYHGNRDLLNGFSLTETNDFINKK